MENSMEVPWKTKNRSTKWSCNSTPEPIPKENHNSKRYMHPSVHCSTVYNSQDTEATWMSIDRGMDKEDVVYTYSLPRWHNRKASACQCKRHKRPSFYPWVRKMPWWRKWQPEAVFLPGKSHGQRSLANYNPWGHKELNITEHAHTHTHTQYIYTMEYYSVILKKGTKFCHFQRHGWT